MKKIGIMADSHSGILKQEAEELDIHDSNFFHFPFISCVI